MGRRSAWQYKQHEEARKERMKVNPAWRGVGCLLVVGIALAAFAFSGWFLRENNTQQWIYFPPDVVNPEIPIVGEYLAGGLLVQLVLVLFAALTAFGILNVAYAILFPKQPGEFDVPKPKKKLKTPKARY